MNLFLTATSERGKPVNKSGNEAIIAEVLDKNRDKLITLHITHAHSHLRGAHYNIYLQNHQSEYIDIKNEK
jgi:ABC-type transport system involved in cytochrome bd biosynthesis fused ATPase/permease subunit